MSDNNLIPLNLVIGDRTYRVRINPKDEEVVRKTVKTINDKKKATFSLATSDYYKNQKGEKVEETQWHNIVIWGNLAEVAEKYLKKGSEIALEGKLVHRVWETNGEKKYMTEISVNELEMLSKKSPQPTAP